jgi:hypothetical protein
MVGASMMNKEKTAMGNQYWIRRNGKETGPYDSKTVRTLAESGRLSRTDAVSPDRMRWVEAASIGGLSFPAEEKAIVPRSDASSALGARLAISSQPDEVVAAALEKVRALCIDGEDVRYIAVQRKPIFTLTPDTIALTTRRLIIIRAGLLGKAKIGDWVWRDIGDVHITEGIVGSTVTVRLASGPIASIDYIPKECARALYRIAQEQEDIAREERRAREMEESRARAGGVNILNAPPSPTATNPVDPFRSDPVEAMKRLRMMKEEGLITAAEYETKRAEIVARM